MKTIKLFFAALVIAIFSFGASAQVTDTTAYLDSWGTYWSKKTGEQLQTPGNLIISAQGDRALGTGAILLGTFVMVSPTILNQAHERSFVNASLVLGSVFTGIGVALHVSGHIKTKKAGILLNQNGVGIRVKL